VGMIIPLFLFSVHSFFCPIIPANMGKEITIDDLQTLKRELLEEIKKLLALRQSAMPSGWLKSHQVRRLLTLSPGKLLQLRNAGILPYTKVGRIVYYEASDIENLLRKRKHHGRQGTDSTDAATATSGTKS
jgi:hypothetical protein